MKFSDAFDSKPDNNVAPIRRHDEGTEKALPTPKTAFKKETEQRLQFLCTGMNKPRTVVIEEAIAAYYFGNNDMHDLLKDAVAAMRDTTDVFHKQRSVIQDGASQINALRRLQKHCSSWERTIADKMETSKNYQVLSGRLLEMQRVQIVIDEMIQEIQIDMPKDEETRNDP